MTMTQPKYKIFEKNCEVCGEPFRRSGPIDAPPRFCGQDCLNKWRVGKAYEKYVVPEEWIPVIRRTYQKGTGNGEIRDLAKRMNIPRTKLTNIARANGWLPRRCGMAERYWSEAEDRIVERTGHMAPITVQRRLKDAGHHRTVAAIEIRRTKLRAVQNRKGMTALALSECLGIDCHSITNAIRKGRIPAKKRPGYKGETAGWFIRSKDVKNYIVDYLPQIDFRKIDKYWLVDLLMNA